jgi:trk system potassium uptake protein TrkH
MRYNRGQASTSWQARPSIVVKAVLSHGHILTGVMAVPTAVALIEREWSLALALGGATLACVFGALLSTRFGIPRDLRENEAVCSLVALFLLLSVLPVPAFSVLGMGVGDALFESVSGVTSTGLTVAQGTMEWPFAGHVLRGWLQWTGGFAIAVAGVALILGPGAAASTMGSVGIEDRDILSSTRAQARDLLVAYSAITAFAIAVLILLLPTWQEGVAIALTAVSTGGFTPRPDSLASYSVGAQAVVIVFCLATSVSLISYVYLRKRDWRGALQHSEAAGFTGFALSGLVLVALVLWLTGQPSWRDMIDAMFNFLSGLSTAGFSTAEINTESGYLALVLLCMLIGGGVGSTAGGVKFNRVITLASMVRLSILRLRVPPRAVTSLRDGNSKVAADRVISIGAVVFCYAVSALVFWMVFLLSGEPPLSSLFEVISALSTVGLSSGLTGAEMQPHLKYALMAAMLLGRLEFLALLLALSPGTWIKRS